MISMLVNILLSFIISVEEKKAKSTKIKLVLSIFLPGKLYSLQILDTFLSFKDMMKCHLLSEAFPDSSGHMTSFHILS